MAPSKDTFSLHGVRKRFRYSERRQTYVYEDGSAIPESELAIISRELYRSTSASRTVSPPGAGSNRNAGATGIDAVTTSSKTVSFVQLATTHEAGSSSARPSGSVATGSGQPSTSQRRPSVHADRQADPAQDGRDTSRPPPHGRPGKAPDKGDGEDADRGPPKQSAEQGDIYRGDYQRTHDASCADSCLPQDFTQSRQPLQDFVIGTVIEIPRISLPATSRLSAADATSLLSSGVLRYVIIRPPTAEDPTFEALPITTYFGKGVEHAHKVHHAVIYTKPVHIGVPYGTPAEKPRRLEGGGTELPMQTQAILVIPYDRIRRLDEMSRLNFFDRTPFSSDERYIRLFGDVDQGHMEALMTQCHSVSAMTRRFTGKLPPLTPRGTTSVASGATVPHSTPNSTHVEPTSRLPTGPTPGRGPVAVGASAGTARSAARPAYGRDALVRSGPSRLDPTLAVTRNVTTQLSSSGRVDGSAQASGNVVPASGRVTESRRPDGYQYAATTTPQASGIGSYSRDNSSSEGSVSDRDQEPSSAAPQAGRQDPDRTRNTQPTTGRLSTDQRPGQVSVQASGSAQHRESTTTKAGRERYPDTRDTPGSTGRPDIYQRPVQVLAQPSRYGQTGGNAQDGGNIQYPNLNATQADRQDLPRSRDTQGSNVKRDPKRSPAQVSARPGEREPDRERTMKYSDQQLRPPERDAPATGPQKSAKSPNTSGESITRNQPPNRAPNDRGITSTAERAPRTDTATGSIDTQRPKSRVDARAIPDRSAAPPVRQDSLPNGGRITFRQMLDLFDDMTARAQNNRLEAPPALDDTQLTLLAQNVDAREQWKARIRAAWNPELARRAMDAETARRRK
ncbi:hypothetical protein LTR29_006509 [Friedmanniomyces endolithicus]|nr:hypothetical protein LTR29_006509 [Friedmanniomyces endolithicus]